MVTANQAAEAVQLKQVWQDRYKARTREILQNTKHEKTLCVCLVGRAGVGKGSLINHLLLRPQATVSHTSSGDAGVERVYTIGNLRISDIPSYDGRHAVASQYKSGHEHKMSSACGALVSKRSDDPNVERLRKDGRLSLNQFVEAYRLFEEETGAIIFVVNNRITSEDRELIGRAQGARKFFVVVRTYADPLARIRNAGRQVQMMDEMEEEMRKDLGLEKCFNIRIFKISIPWSQSNNKTSTDPKDLQSTEMEDVIENVTSLDFPVFKLFMSEPKGLIGEILISKMVQEEVWNVLQQFQTVRMWYRLLDFSENIVIGTLIPLVGPVCLTFLKTLIYTIKACSHVGFVKEPEKAVQKLVAETKSAKLVTHAVTKDGLTSSIHEVMLEIFGEVIYEIAINDLVKVSAEATLSETVPLLGPFMSAARLPKRYRDLTEKLFEKTCMIHELWIRHNITKLLQMSSPEPMRMLTM